MSEDYNEEEMLSLENDFEVSVQTLDDLDRRTLRVASNNAVDRLTMESIYKDYPETVNDNYPLASYTKDPSDQNLAVSLESFDLAKKFAIAAAGAVLGGLLYMLIKMFRTDGAAHRAENVDANVADIQKKDKTISTMIVDARKANLNPADKKQVKAIEDNNYREYATDLKLIKASSQGKIFLDAIAPGGDVFQTLTKWSRSIHNHYSNFSGRVNTLTELIGKMYDLDAKDLDKFLKDIDKAILSPDDPFFDEMGRLHDTFQSFLRGSGGEYNAFLTSSVFQTHEFYDLALMDDGWYKRVQSISPNGEKQLEKNLDRLEKDAQMLIDGKRAAALNAKKANRKHRMDEDGNVEMNAITSNLTVERAVKDAELAIRSEIQHLRVYRQTLGRALKFYQMLSIKTLEMNNERARLLRDILNRNPID